MSTPEQGGVRPDQSGVDFTGQIREAQAQAEQVAAVQWQAAMAEPGVGALAGGSDVTMSPNYGSALNADSPGAAVMAVGEGYQHTAPDAPRQTDGRPTYAADAVGDESPFIGGA